MIKKYKILNTIMLGFTDGREQGDVLFNSEDGFYLESDGETIWVIKEDKRYESITIANAIEIWKEQKFLEEMDTKIFTAITTIGETG
jgi:hypothetical protein